MRAIIGICVVLGLIILFPIVGSLTPHQASPGDRVIGQAIKDHLSFAFAPPATGQTKQSESEEYEESPSHEPKPSNQNELEFYYLGTVRNVTDRNPYYNIVHYSTAIRWQLTNISNHTVTIRGFKINRRTDCTQSVQRTLAPGETFVWFSSFDNCGELVRIDVDTDRTNEFWTRR